MGLHEIKKILHDKRNDFKIEEAAAEWENIIASYTLGKVLLTRIYRKLNKTKFPKAQ
jgi:hypothetical protein